MDYIVNTPCGPVQGCPGKQAGVAAYKGIRYATAGRWEYPRQVTSWEGIYDATAYGSCSYQPRAFYGKDEFVRRYFYYNEFRKDAVFTYSEDCLFLNIFAPADAREGDNLPVLVYIHGGSFTGGCSHEKHLDGPVWPRHGVIGVTLNYRLGPLGFLCLPELKEEAGITGNYGLYDQLTALQWIRDNIASFGGDPEAITIMGQSAGAMSVQQHCLSPLSQGLFSKAVMSSGAGVSKIMGAAAPERSYSFWRSVMKLAGCENLEQFRTLAPEQLFAAWQTAKKQNVGSMRFCTPCLDGRLVVGAGAEILAAGTQRQIPYLCGITSEDIAPPVLFNMTRNWITAQSKPSFAWYFDRKLPGDNNGAWHSSDLWYWFGTLENGWRPWEKKDYLLSMQMVEYLTNFVKTGDPNGSHNDNRDFCIWEPVSKSNQALRLGEGESQMGKVPAARLIKAMFVKKAVVI